MKKIYTIFLFSFLCTQMLIAQNLEYLWSDGFLSSTNHVQYSSADNSWIVGGVFINNQNNSAYTNGKTYLSKIDSSGAVVWKNINHNSFPVPSVGGMDILSNNNIILLAQLSDCDVGLPDSLIQYNTNGVEISRIQSPIPFSNAIKAIDNNRFILSSFYKIVLMDNNFNVIWTHLLANPSINPISFRQAPNGNIFAFTSDKVLNLDINNGVAYSSYPSNNQLIPAQEGAFFYVIDESENVALMDTSYNFGFASFSIANHFDKVYKTELLGSNQIAVYGQKNGRANLKLFNSGFTLIDSLDWDVEHLYINDFTFNDNQIMVAGIDFSEKYSTSTIPYYTSYFINEGSSHSFLKSFDYNLNNNVVGVDAGVTEVSYNDYTTVFDSCGSFYYSFNFIINDIDITIKNYGTQTINHLELLHRQTQNCPSFCPTAKFYTLNIDTISLAPNATTTIHINQIEVPLQFAGAPFDFCFWTGEVNHQIDIDHSNDKSCQQLTNTISQQQVQYINVYPNPSSDYINVDLPSTFQNSTIEIISSTGQTLRVEDNLNINISDLADGFYIIKGKTDKGLVFIGKFIKQ